MFVDRKEKSITRATVMKAYGKVVELDGAVKGPKTLGTFGASYMFIMNTYSSYVTGISALDTIPYIPFWRG